MKPGGGKKKGSQFEREVCKALSMWISRNTKSDLFWRSAISGGRATVAHKKGTDLARQAGDITATAEEGYPFIELFFVECKRVSTLGITNFVYNRSCPIRTFWTIACQQALRHNRAPMVIAQEDRGEIIVLMQSSVASQYRWARDSAIARVMDSPTTSIAVLSFNQLVTETTWSTRIVLK